MFIYECDEKGVLGGRQLEGLSDSFGYCRNSVKPLSDQNHCVNGRGQSLLLVPPDLNPLRKLGQTPAAKSANDADQTASNALYSFFVDEFKNILSEDEAKRVRESLYKSKPAFRVCTTPPDCVIKQEMQIVRAVRR